MSTNATSHTQNREGALRRLLQRWTRGIIVKRYPHFLARAKHASYPAAIVTLHCTTTKSGGLSVGSRQYERLAGWYASSVVGKQGCYGRMRQWEGIDYGSFWSALERLTQRTGLTYVYSWQAVRCGSLLSLFHLAEQGKLSLSATDTAKSQQHKKHFKGPLEPLCVMEDAPTIIEASMNSNQCRFLWLDTRNHGIDRDGEPDSPLAWTGQLLTWIVDAIRVLRDRQLGGWKTTSGSQAFHSYRYASLHTPIYCHVNRRALELERAAYYGGRCEAFKIGRFSGPIYHLDIRSMYPYCCGVGSVPVRLQQVVNDCSLNIDYLATVDRCVIADVTVSVKQPLVPVRHNGIICWPTGTFRTSLCSPELRVIREHGMLYRVHSCAIYETEPALSSFALAWYRIRQEADESGNKLLSSWSKSVMVCLVGKFGQRCPTWLYEPNLQASKPWECWHSKGQDGKPQRFRSLNWIVQSESVAADGVDSVCSVAAHITSMGRMLLWHCLRTAGMENCYYCDTDSVMCNVAGMDRLANAGMVAAGEWGRLQLKGIHDTIEVFAPKYYALDGIVKCSGMPASLDAIGPLPNTVWYRQSVKSSLRLGQEPEALRVLRTYARHSPYSMGVVLPSGEVRPFHLGG